MRKHTDFEIKILIMNLILNIYRYFRIKMKQLRGIEPIISVQFRIAQEFHGSEYGGWRIPASSLGPESVVVDVGLGEDISFSTSLIDHYQCNVHGFDPTPRAIDYVEKLSYPRFNLHKFGLASRRGRASFYLPNNEQHVSGSLKQAKHTGSQQIEVDLVNLDDVVQIIGSDHIDLLKLDIEGAEYELLLDECFARHAARICILCIEFHHRWPNHGANATEEAIKRLNELGFQCIWVNLTTNEEFTFVRRLP